MLSPVPLCRLGAFRDRGLSFPFPSHGHRDGIFQGSLHARSRLEAVSTGPSLPVNAAVEKRGFISLNGLPGQPPRQRPSMHACLPPGTKNKHFRPQCRVDFVVVSEGVRLHPFCPPAPLHHLAGFTHQIPWLLVRQQQVTATPDRSGASQQVIDNSWCQEG